MGAPVAPAKARSACHAVAVNASAGNKLMWGPVGWPMRMQRGEAPATSGAVALRSRLLCGYTDEARRMVVPLLEFNRQATRYHVAGHKLELLKHYYWVTRDGASLRAWDALWRPVIDFSVCSRRKDNGLLP